MGPADARSRLRDYFLLDQAALPALYSQWGTPKAGNGAKPHPLVDINVEFKRVASSLSGMRLLRQDPEECLFAFICSQNNNVKRITMMLDVLRKHYGKLIEVSDGVEYRAFPTIDTIASIPEQALRDLGFGYRAKYIPKAAQQILDRQAVHGPGWLRSLRTLPREDVKTALVAFAGIGPKVADCISLFSLDKFDLVPVDTHMWQIAQRFMPHLRSKNLNAETYTMIGDFFRDRFGPWAGWAHTVLFAAELSGFRKELAQSGTDADETELKPTKLKKKTKASKEAAAPAAQKRSRR